MDYVKLTNAGLELNTAELLKNTMLTKIILLNDFEAVGYSLDLLNLNKDCLRLPHTKKSRSEIIKISNYASIGAGTGLGMCIAPYDKVRKLHIPLASEGGHADFPPYDELEMDLVKFIKRKKLTDDKLHPDFENVLSGVGLETIYDFLTSRKGFKKSIIVKEINKLKRDDKLKEIESNCGGDNTCKKTVDLFMKFYARAAKNLALMSKCYSGLFIAGNIALKHISDFKRNEFMQEFEKHDKRPDILRKIPVYVITNRDASLLGCSNAAINFFD